MGNIGTIFEKMLQKMKIKNTEVENMENMKSMENMESIKRILEKFKEETAIPSIVLTIERSANIAVTDSKFGGVPYLPKDYVYPASSKGQPLKLLAQINFAQLPKLENFPAGGILQFYVLHDETIGLVDWPTMKQDTFRVIYHKEVLPGEYLMKDFPTIPYVGGGEHGEEWFPFEGEFLLRGNIADCPITPSTYEFNDAFAAYCEKNNCKSHFELYFADWENVRRSMTKSEFKEFDRKKREIEDLVFDTIECGEKHRISGYPFFTQEDQRVHCDSLKKYDTLLLQIASEYTETEENIMWGDAGVANFFINLEALKNLNFQDVMYNWDCC